jgi:hypothetical protein
VTRFDGLDASAAALFGDAVDGDGVLGQLAPVVGRADEDGARLDLLPVRYVVGIGDLHGTRLLRVERAKALLPEAIGLRVGEEDVFVSHS